MITVEDLLMAFALAYDTWLDPEVERENPLPEYAELIREAVSSENTELRELALGLRKCLVNEGCEGCPMQDDDGWCVRDIRLRELGVDV